MIQFHEYGKEYPQHIVLIHPSLVLWDYFQDVIPYLEKNCHIIVPALPGYIQETEEDFTSVEQIADELAQWLNTNGYHEIDCLYGCSMGGAIVVRMLADKKVMIHRAVLDGAITPYPYPWIVTRLIAIKDFAMIALGKLGGIKLLEKAFAMDEYSHEDLEYVADIFKWLSYTTIWRTFESCNNYKMPEPAQADCKQIQYWYGDGEVKERKGDLRYVAEQFPQTEFVCMKELGHAGMALKRPAEFAQRIRILMCEGK